MAQKSLCNLIQRLNSSAKNLNFPVHRSTVLSKAPQLSAARFYSADGKFFENIVLLILIN